jgi:hypothetical protein
MLRAPGCQSAELQDLEDRDAYEKTVADLNAYRPGAEAAATNAAAAAAAVAALGGGGAVEGEQAKAAADAASWREKLAVEKAKEVVLRKRLAQLQGTAAR